MSLIGGGVDRKPPHALDVVFNGQAKRCQSFKEMGLALDGFDREPIFEFRLTVPHGA